MHACLVAHLVHSCQQTPHLPLADTQFFSRLSLRDLLVLRLLQGHQPIPIGLVHEQFSWLLFQLPGSPLSIGHFYFAQLGHSHFAPTPEARGLASLEELTYHSSHIPT